MPFITANESGSKSKKYIKNQINKIKDFLKNDETMQKSFADHGVDIEWIEYIPVKFDYINVSAKTDHGVVILNYKLLFNNNFEEITGYALHEFIHYLQQCFGEEGTQSSNDGNYLDNPYEQEAFKKQIEFIADNKSKEDAEDYVEQLLDHHDINSSNERKEKSDILLSQV